MQANGEGKKEEEEEKPPKENFSPPLLLLLFLSCSLGRKNVQMCGVILPHALEEKEETFLKVKHNFNELLTY